MDLIDLMDHDGPEARLQGLLTFALEHHEDFRRALATLCGRGRPDFRTVVTEQTGEGVRFDVVMTSRSGAECRLELKLWAPLTDGQRRAIRRGEIHAILLPDSRKEECQATLRRMRRILPENLPRLVGWSEVEGAAHGTGAEPLLSGIAAYSGGDGQLDDELIPAEIRGYQQSKTWYRLYRFMKSLQVQVEGDDNRLDLDGGVYQYRGSGHSCSYYGMNLTLRRRGRGKPPYAGWTGLVWRPGREDRWLWILQVFQDDAWEGVDERPRWMQNEWEGPVRVLRQPGQGVFNAEKMAAEIARAIVPLVG